MNSEYGQLLDEILVQGSQAWDCARYERSYGDPKTQALAIGRDNVNRAFRYALGSVSLRPECNHLVPHHWYRVVHALAGDLPVRFELNEDGTALALLIAGRHMRTLPLADRTLGVRFGQDLAYAIVLAVLAVKGVFEPRLLLDEVGGVVPGDLEFGVRLAWDGAVEDGARRIARALARLLVTMVSAIALGSLARVVKMSANTITHTKEANAWVLKLPEPVHNRSRAAEDFGLTLDQIDALSRRSRSTILVARTGGDGKPVVAELTMRGFRLAGLDAEDPDFGPSKTAEVMAMSRALFAYSRKQYASEGPFLFARLGARRRTPRAEVEGKLPPRVLPASEPLLVAIDAKVFPMAWPDLADFCYANDYYGCEYPWARGRYFSNV